ncbi:TPA: SDR family NAD(P)-dependent oxidoreductase, partial [Candidatus Poribacteria bacterium]|nr:SDR family NAD(P)-dependent oxidoreductase [Candidatus Poribacteria bacterium]
MKLENKVAIITKSGGGIGRAVALRYAREGAKCVVVDIQGEQAE